MYDIELSEDQRMIRDMARDFARSEVAPNAQAWEKAGWIDDGVVRTMGELGLLGMIVPEQWQGTFVDYVAYAVAVEEISAGDGALGAFAFGIGATEMASVWALGVALNVEVPETIKVVLRGELPEFVSPKDIILHLIGRLSAEGANFKVLEFHGDAVRDMKTSGRLVLCNMAVEAGATAGIVPADRETLRYLRDVAGVQGAHGWNQPDGLSLAPQRLEPSAQRRYGIGQRDAHFFPLAATGTTGCSWAGKRPSFTSAMYSRAASRMVSARCAYCLTNDGTNSSNNPNAS